MTNKKTRSRPGYVTPKRRDTKAVVGHVPRTLHEDMLEVAKSEGKTLQEAVAEAFAEYVRKYKGPQPG
jgi:hypothetical protein